MNVSMNNLVSTINSFSALGNNIVMQPMVGKDGSLMGRSINLATAQADQDSQLIHSLAEQIRHTNGLGDSQADFVSNYFGNLVDRGIPLTGTIVASAMKAVLAGEQGKSVASMKMTLQEFANFMDKVPDDARPAPSVQTSAGLPEGIENVTDTELGKFLDENTVTLGDAPDSAAGAEKTEASESTQNVEDDGPKALPDAALFEEAQNELEAFRENYGGSQNFVDRRPVFESEAKATLGRSHDTLYHHWKNKAEEAQANGKSSAFETKMAEHFRDTEFEETKYDYKYLSLESLRLLSIHRDTIAEAYGQSEKAGNDAMMRLTRLTPHSNINGGSAGVVFMMDHALRTFESGYSMAKQQGRLKEFFDKALDGACFPARARAIIAAEKSMRPPVVLKDPRGVEYTPEMGYGEAASNLYSELFDDVYKGVTPNKDGEYPWKPMSDALFRTLEGRVYQNLDKDLNAIEETEIPMTRELVDNNIRRYLSEVQYIDFTD